MTKPSPWPPRSGRLRYHFREVSGGCGKRRVIALNVMAGDQTMTTITLARYLKDGMPRIHNAP